MCGHSECSRLRTNFVLSDRAQLAARRRRWAWNFEDDRTPRLRSTTMLQLSLPTRGAPSLPGAALVILGVSSLLGGT